MSHRTSPILAPLRIRLSVTFAGIYTAELPLECEHCEEVRQTILRWYESAARDHQSAEDQGDVHSRLFDAPLRPLESLDG